MHCDAVACSRTPARTLSCSQASDYSIHARIYLCLLSYRLHSNSIQKPSHEQNGRASACFTVKPTCLWLNKSRVRRPGSMQERISCVAGSLQTALAFPCFPVVPRRPNSRGIQSGQRIAHSHAHRSSQPVRTNCPAQRCSHMQEIWLASKDCAYPIQHNDCIHTNKTIQPQAQIVAQGVSGGCVRRPRRIQSSPEINNERTFQDVRTQHRRAGFGSVTCVSLPRVLRCHARMPGGDEHELKSLTHSTSPFTSSPQHRFKHRYYSCAYSLPTRAFTIDTKGTASVRTQTVRLHHTRPRVRNLVLLPKRSYPFRDPSPYHTSEPQSIPRSNTSAP